MKQFIFKLHFPVLLLFIIVSFLNSCLNSSDNKKTNTPRKNVTSKNKPPSSFSDTVKINSPAAVFYSPDSLQLEKIKVITDSMTFNSIGHECYYLMRNARITLKDYQPEIGIIETTKARYLLFIKSDKSRVCIDLNTQNDMCGIFLFNQVKEPLLVDMANIDTELNFYFRK